MSEQINRASAEESIAKNHNTGNDEYNPLAEYPAHLQSAQWTPRYIDPSEYETNEVVQTVRELVNNSRDDTWRGTASELLAAGQQKMRLTDLTAGQVEQQIKDLEDYLLLYDDIYHFFYRSGNATLHGFCGTQPDEDGVY